ncbi:MAG: hypothetical protein KatS3mg056_3964 [Chloroflexus sp.]|nr:MAG: hypothetical protein KatS3mg056_2938 [Chloroflexus sp.]GIV95255.1 MAG: hypothetical protein KatS3mg056_3964 [Chloroflexus sp.]
MVQAVLLSDDQTPAPSPTTFNNEFPNNPKRYTRLLQSLRQLSVNGFLKLSHILFWAHVTRNE